MLDSTATINQLEQFSRFIETTFGILFSIDKRRDLLKIVREINKELGYDDEASLIEHFVKDTLVDSELELLAEFITIGETYFFREIAALKAFENEILTLIMKNKFNKKRHIKIWCAGCASGEEAYTIAMILDGNKSLLKDWKIEILATDINMKFLQKAETGLYTKWSFRDLPKYLTGKYFTQHNENSFEIIPEIKRMVDFSQLNLILEKSILQSDKFSNIDIVFCRNVLMYFSPENIGKTVEKFYQSLTYDGWLAVSQTELSQEYFNNFRAIYFHNAVIYKKLISAEKTTIKPLSNKKHNQKKVSNTNFEQATISANQGDLNGAEKYCLEALKTDGFNSHFLFLLATILKEKGNLDESVTAFRKVVFSDKSHVLAYYNLGNIALTKRQNKEADKQFKLALYYLNNLDPDKILDDSGEMHAGKLIQLIESQIEKIN